MHTMGSLVPRPFLFLRALGTRETQAQGKIQIFPRAHVSCVPSVHKNRKGLGTRLYHGHCSVIPTYMKRVYQLCDMSTTYMCVSILHH